MKNILIVILVLGISVGAFILTNRSEPLAVSVVGPQRIDTRCYAQKELLEGDLGYSYSFARFDIFSDMSVEGYLGYFPYGVDASSGSYVGTLLPEDDIITGEYTFFAEGQTGTEERFVRLTDIGLLFGFGPMELSSDGVYRYANTDFIEYDYPVPSAACNRYDAWYLELFGV